MPMLKKNRSCASNKKYNLFGINTKFQQLTMQLLFGRFPHLVEDIFGLLNGDTLHRCSHINQIWNKNLEEYRLYLVKKIQKLLKNPNIIYGPASDFEEREHQNTPRIPFENSIITMYPTYPARILMLPLALRRNFMVEQLPLLILVQFLKLFSNYYEIKDCDEVNFRILWIKKTYVMLGVFIKNKSQGVEICKFLRIITYSIKFII